MCLNQKGSGNLGLQFHCRDIFVMDQRILVNSDRPVSVIVNIFLKLSKQFQLLSKPNATCPPYSISPPNPAELLANVKLI